MPHCPRVAAMISALLLLAACTDADPDASASASSSSSSSSSASTAAATTSSAAPATPTPATPTDEQLPDDGSSPADTGDDGGPAQGGSDGRTDGMRVTGIRLSGQNGASTLVVDLSGSGVPEWTVGYSEPTGPGGGPVGISGDAFLRVQLRTGTQPSGQSNSRVSASPGPVVEARTTGYFEGTEEVLIGVRGAELPFRAYPLTDPGRIVIEVPPAG